MQPTPAKTSPAHFNLYLTYEALSKAIREKGRQKKFPLPPMKQMEKDVEEIVKELINFKPHTIFPYDEMAMWMSNEIERRLNLPKVSPTHCNPVYWLYTWACAMRWRDYRTPLSKDDEELRFDDKARFLQKLGMELNPVIKQDSASHPEWHYLPYSVLMDPENSWWLAALDQAGKLAQALKGLDESVLRALRDAEFLSRDYQPLPGYNHWHKIVIVEEYTEFLELTDKPWAQFELLWGMSRRNLKKHADRIPEAKKKKEVDKFRTKIKECLKAQKHKNSALGL